MAKKKRVKYAEGQGVTKSDTFIDAAALTKSNPPIGQGDISYKLSKMAPVLMPVTTLKRLGAEAAKAWQDKRKKASPQKDKSK